jgi:hypothetical protein
VILHSKDLDKIMDWLAPEDREITG